MIRRAILPVAVVLSALAMLTPGAMAADPPCDLVPRSQCFGLESVEASLSTTEAGAHPDLTFSFEVKQEPESEPNVFGLHKSYAPVRNVSFDLPPGLIGDPNVLGVPQQCTVEELLAFNEAGGGCPNGSQVGVSKIFLYGLTLAPTEPIYMMQPPGGDVAARVGFIAGIYPTFVDFRVRSASDYGLTATVSNASPIGGFVKVETTTWGVPAAPVHDTQRCTVSEALIGGCVTSPSRPPGSRQLPFLTNPTRCGVALSMSVSIDSWLDPGNFDTESASFPEIIGCNMLPFGPSLEVAPTTRRAASASGAEVTIRLPASDGADVLEPSQMKDIEVKLPDGFAFNPSAGDGLTTCSSEQARFQTNLPSECPDTSKLANTEFDIPVLERKLRGAVYLREPEPGKPFRIWIVADDLGLHVKLPGELDVNKQTGQITSVTTDIPQAPVREAKLIFKSGFRAPLVTPQVCGEYRASYEFTPWSGGPSVTGSTPMRINEGCDEVGGFSPKLSAGTTRPAAGKYSPFLFRLTWSDGEQNPEHLNVTLPRGFAAKFAGIPRCLGAAAEAGLCPVGSRIGKVVAAVGAGPNPLWVPQPGKRPTAVYLSGPYKGAPLSIVAVVPRQAGPFDFGDEVVRSAVYVDPVTAQATAKADPLPQRIEGIPITYRTIHVELDRPGFTLNPTSCTRKATEATLISSRGAVARPSSSFQAVNCSSLGFKPKLAFQLLGGTRRGAHPRLRAVLKARPGDANIAGVSVALPHSEFLDQAHIKTVCTRVQFAAHTCPPGSIYGYAVARTPLFDEAVSGPVYLRSSSNPLPDAVVALRGPDSLPIEVALAGRVDSVNGGIRNTFEVIPDAPVNSFMLTLQGGKKGLLVNSTNLCDGTHRATAKFKAQNGLSLTLHPAMQASCGGAKKTRR